MDFPIPIHVIFFIILAIGAVIAVYSHFARKRAMKTFAAQMGMTYSPYDGFGIQSRVSIFPRFQRGHSHRSYDQVYGRYKGHDCCIFHYSYKTGSGKSQSTHTFSGLFYVADISLPGLLSVRPEGMFDKMMEVVGFDDIDFEYNEFNKKYYVKSNNKRMAYDFFGRSMMDYFLMLPRQICMEGQGPYFIFHYDGSLKPEFYARMMDTAASMFTRLDPVAREKFAMSPTAQAHFSGESPSSFGFFGK
ncbi:MAG: hypothetical protein Kow00107_09540 [Planctomycetota bacterium]